MLRAHFSFRKDHPCLADHFPDNPIAPGVLTLDHVSRCLLAQVAGMYVAGFPQVKFMRPVLPGVEVEVTYVKKSDSLYQFKCESRGDTLLLGQIRLAQEGKSLV